MAEPVILTNDELRACCDYWQRVLRLQDWDVVIRLARATELQSGLAFGGEVAFNVEKRAAAVKIVVPEDYQHTCSKDFELVQDMERTVVHELLHLHTAPLNRVIASGSLEERFEENMINALSQALVNLRRRDGH